MRLYAYMAKVPICSDFCESKCLEGNRETLAKDNMLEHT